MYRASASLISTAGFLLCGSLVTCGSTDASGSQDIEELTRPCADATDIVICLEQLVSSHPENAELRGYLADYLAREGQEERALEEIDKALALDPDDIRSHVFRAQLLKKLGDLDGAHGEGERIRELKRSHIEKLLTESVDDTGELLVAAHLASVGGDFRTASLLYQRFLDIEENPHPLTLSDYAEVLARLGRFDSALEVMAEAFSAVEEEDFEERATLLERRAWIKERSGDPAGAEKDRAEYDAIGTHIKSKQ